MKTTRFYFIGFLFLLMSNSLFAQQNAMMTVTPQEALQVLQDWDTETLLDSLDQQRLPRKFSMGLLLNGNCSNFIISQRSHKPMSSYLRVGAEVGGFMDFVLTKHFSIQPQVVFAAEQNRFSVNDSVNNGLWAFGMDIPIFFLGHFGNMQKGYLQFGGGLFTHFQFATNVGNPVVYSGNGKEALEEQRKELEDRYHDLLKLHNNHFGIGVMVGYEFPFGMQFNLGYRISLSDICSYYINNKGTQTANASIYPQKIIFGIGYRFR